MRSAVEPPQGDVGAMSGTAEPGLSPAGQWRIVIALTLISMLALIDKYALSLLVEPIRHDLRISDTQISLIVGTAFAISNIAIGIPAGWMADRFSRRTIIASGVVGWSVMASLCGAASSFWQMFVARAGVGLGEGLIPPACYSLIRSGVSASRRGRAFSVYAMANSVGPGVSLLLGGLLIGLIASAGTISLPGLGALAPWQLTLIIIGVAGLPFALLAYAFRDPGRGDGSSATKTDFRTTFAFVRRHRAIYLPLAIYSCAQAMITHSLGVWTPAFLGRSFGLTPQEIGGTLGLILVVAGPLGLFSAGWLIDLFNARGKPGAGLIAVASALIVAMVGTAVPLLGRVEEVWALMFVMLLFSNCYLAIVSTTVSQHAPSDMVGKIMAAMLVLQGIVGAGLAPGIVGMLADFTYSGKYALSNGLSTGIAIFGAVAMVTSLVLLRNLRSSAAAMRAA